MMHMARRGLFGLGLAALGGGAMAQTPSPAPSPTPPFSPAAAERIPLWPLGVIERAPNGLVERLEGGVVGVAEPRLEVFRPLPELDRKRAMLVITGGGYRRLVLDNEGYNMARYLVAQGVTACVLVHRLPSEGWSRGAEAPLQDAQRAMQVIRHRAADWGIDADQVSVIGFSAGGHLAGALATRYAAPNHLTADAVDALPARPVFAGLIYPVISMEAEMNHGTTRRNLIGETPTPEQVRLWSVDRHVTVETPPCFLVHATDDPIVPVENSFLMYRALQAAKVRAELHVFESGGHGFGLTANPTARAWPDLFMVWAEAHGLGAPVGLIGVGGPSKS